LPNSFHARNKIYLTLNSRFTRPEHIFYFKYAAHRLFQKVGKLLPDNTATHPRKE
jgi:hypothetical protein